VRGCQLLGEGTAELGRMPACLGAASGETLCSARSPPWRWHVEGVCGERTRSIKLVEVAGVGRTHPIGIAGGGRGAGRSMLAVAHRACPPALNPSPALYSSVRNGIEFLRTLHGLVPTCAHTHTVNRTHNQTHTHTRTHTRTRTHTHAHSHTNVHTHTHLPPAGCCVHRRRAWS